MGDDIDVMADKFTDLIPPGVKAVLILRDHTHQRMVTVAYDSRAELGRELMAAVRSLKQVPEWGNRGG